MADNYSRERHVRVADCTNLYDLQTASNSSFVDAINELKDKASLLGGYAETSLLAQSQSFSSTHADKIADEEVIDDLLTTDKSSLVGAINEVHDLLLTIAGQMLVTEHRHDFASRPEVSEPSEHEVLGRLKTLDQTSLVAAINEVYTEVKNLGWSPLKLDPGLVGWWDAKTPSTLTCDSQNEVSSWSSRLGSLVVTQSDPGSMPVYTPTGFSGLPGLHGGFLSTVMTTALNDVTMVAVYSIAVEAPTVVIGLGDESPVNSIFIAYDAGDYFTLDFSTQSVIPGQPAPCVQIGTYTNGTVQAFLNGVVGDAESDAGMNPQTAISLGSLNGNYVNCDQMCELLVFNRVLTDVERQKLEGYLAWRWGLQTSLVSGHPYRDHPPA